MSEKIKLEAYIAQPPTSKCREVLAVMEEVVRRRPDQVRLVVFTRGAPWPEEPSAALRYAFDKGNTVPMCYANGRFIVGGEVPSLDQVERAVEEALRVRSDD